LLRKNKDNGYWFGREIISSAAEEEVAAAAEKEVVAATGEEVAVPSGFFQMSQRKSLCIYSKI
jgi:hypothetical protein